MNSKKTITKTIHISLTLLIWLFIWNHLNFEFAKTILIYIFPNSINNPSLLIFQSLFLILITGFLITIWFLFFKNISFLKVNKIKTIFLYIIPLLIFCITFLYTKNKTLSTIFQNNFSFIALSLIQDIFTFGILQTYLNKLTNKTLSTILTTTMFFLGHFGFFPANFLIIFYIIGFILFGYLSNKDENIYRTNIIHTSFNLLRHFF